MCVDMSVDVSVGLCADMCVDMSVRVSVDLFADGCWGV